MIWRTLLAGLTLLLAACNPAVQFERSDALIAEFHESYNEGDIRALYDRMGPEFRNENSFEDLNGLVQTVRSQLGKVKSSDGDGGSVDTHDGQMLMTINRNTSFENGGAVENFLFMGTDEDLRMVGWFVEFPPVLDPVAE